MGCAAGQQGERRDRGRAGRADRPDRDFAAVPPGFRTPRELAGGKPAGVKLCLGSRRQFLAVCKAMVDEGATPDFIVVDGAEGGTGAAPLEFADHIGTPLTEGLITLHNALVGTGLRERIRMGASGKVTTGADVIKRAQRVADHGVHGGVRARR